VRIGSPFTAPARAQTIALAARLVQPCRNVRRVSIFGSKYPIGAGRGHSGPIAMQREGEQSSRSIIVMKIGRPRQSRAMRATLPTPGRMLEGSFFTDEFLPYLLNKVANRFHREFSRELASSGFLSTTSCTFLS